MRPPARLVLQQKMTDKDLIQQTISYYAEGGTNGDPETAAKAFHSTAYMKFIKAGEFTDVPIEDFLLNFIQKGKSQQRTVTVNYIDITGDAASAKLTLDYPTHRFVDYFNLLKIKEQWLIVSKIFYRIDK